MTAASKQFAELSVLSTGVEAFEEAQQRYLLLKDAILPSGCVPSKMDLLLRQTEKGDGYGSVLYFAEHVRSERSPPPQPAPNWQGPARILERNWQWYSWQVPVGEPLTLLARILVHLRPLGS